MSPAGEIVDAFLPTDRDTGRPRGFGFVTFASEDQAQACIEQFNGQELDGRPLNINPADDRRRGGGGGGGGGGGKPRRQRSPIAEFKRGGGGPPASERPAPTRPPTPAEIASPAYDTPAYDVDERKFQPPEDEEDEPSWKKKKKKRKGSRRGLRAKKRSL